MSNNLNIIEISEMIRDHLINQNRQAIGSEHSTQGGPICMYRGNDNCKCAVGILIKDEFYCDSLENLTIMDDAIQSAVAKSLGVEDLTKKDTEFLRSWQMYHDTDYGNWVKFGSDLLSPIRHHAKTIGRYAGSY